MPTPQGPETNPFRCDACGRFFNTEGELAQHSRECAAARATGGGDKPAAHSGEREEDREWTSTP